MASYGYTFQSGDGVTPTRLNDARTISEIVNADIKSDAAIAGSKLADGAITNAKVSASAAITGTKILPDFGSQNVKTTGNVLVGNITGEAGKIHARADGNEPKSFIVLQNKDTGAAAGGTIAFLNGAVDLGDDRYCFIRAIVTAAGHNGNHLIFATNANGNSPSERLRIDSTGNVGIGTSSPATRLHVDGTIRYTNRPSAGTITAIGFDANGDLRASSSSRRYKHEIAPYSKGLEEVSRLEPVTFKYNGEELINAGLIVEDLAAQGLEEFVLRDSGGTADAIPYGNMVALLINAIKELKTRVEALEAA